jgi:hypothetical protein
MAENQSYGFVIKPDGSFSTLEHLADAETGDIFGSELVKVVPGIEILPTKPNTRTPYLAYFSGCSWAPDNNLAAAVMDEIGFDLSVIPEGRIFGDVVFVSYRDTGLTLRDIARLEIICCGVVLTRFKTLEQVTQMEESSNPSSSPPPPPPFEF